MSLDFLRNYGANRVTSDISLPELLDTAAPKELTPDEQVHLSFETPVEDWQPIEVEATAAQGDWPYKPERFVDGKDNGHTVAWLRGPEGQVVPVRVAQIGGIAMRVVAGELRREFALTDKVVVLSDVFPWDEMESFARALRTTDFRLLLCRRPDAYTGHLYDPMQKAAQSRSIDEMVEFERLAFSRDRDTPTILDGPLAPRASIPTDNASPAIGIIKTHATNYLPPQGWQVFYDLTPGQRTPAFRLESKGWGNWNVITWYLRLAGGSTMPNWGVVRLEMPESFFANKVGGDFDYLNRVSRLVYDYRCQDSEYRRAPISLHPIQRAEESLGALFTNAEAMISRFYHLTNL